MIIILWLFLNFKIILFCFLNDIDIFKLNYKILYIL